jgi:hypothetical protein
MINISYDVKTKIVKIFIFFFSYLLKFNKLICNLYQLMFLIRVLYYNILQRVLNTHKLSLNSEKNN